MKKKGLVLMIGILLMHMTATALAGTKDDYIFCEKCRSYYQRGDEFNDHVCAGEQAVQCSTCGGWYKLGEAFYNHTCIIPDDNFIVCSICGKRYLKGTEYNTHNCFQPKYVYCSVCGGSYLEGNEYRNHLCVSKPSNNQKAIGTLYVDTTNGGNLRMRARPDTNSPQVTSLKNGTALKLYSYANSQWAYVGYKDYYGYCMIRYLSDVPPGKKPAVTLAPAATQNLYENFVPANYWVLVNPSVPTGFVNLRWAPSLDAPVQNIYYANTMLRVIFTNGTWCQVIDEQNNLCGFMMSAYMKRMAY